MIGSRVESPEKLLERLEELRTIIQEKVSDKDCPFILSTMHASKGLEYDTVYLLDVMDGILPEKVLANPRTASKEELETYEEERRLFYVGVTRAKNQLNVFTTNKPSKFCSELLGKRNLRENQQKEYAGIKKWGDYSPAGTYGIKGNGMYHGYGTDHPDRDTDLTSDRNLHRYRSGTVRYHHGIKLWYRPSDTAGWISSFHRFCSQRCKDGARGKSNPPVLSVYDLSLIHI